MKNKEQIRMTFFSSGDYDILRKEVINNRRRKINEEKNFNLMKIVRTLFDKLINEILLSNIPTLCEKDYLVPNYYKKELIREERSLFGFKYTGTKERESNEFLTSREVASFSSQVHTNLEDLIIRDPSDFGPDYKIVNELLERVESRTTEKIQKFYREKTIKDINNLIWEVVEKEINLLNNDINSLIKILLRQAELKEIVLRESVKMRASIIRENVKNIIDEKNKIIREKDEIILSLEQQIDQQKQDVIQQHS